MGSRRSDLASVYRPWFATAVSHILRKIQLIAVEAGNRVVAAAA
jgi:hypothetical protein